MFVILCIASSILFSSMSYLAVAQIEPVNGVWVNMKLINYLKKK